MKHNAFYLILIAGMLLAMTSIAQISSLPTEANNTDIPISGNTTTATSANMTQGNSTSGEYVQGELLVRFNPGAFPNINALNALSMQAHATIGAVKIDAYPDIAGLELIRLPPAMSVKSGIAYYEAIPTVMYAEPNAIYTIASSPGQGNSTLHPPPTGNTTSVGDLFVQYNSTAFEKQGDLQIYANATNAAINASVVTDYTLYGMAGLQLINLQANMTSTEGIAYYRNITNVEYAEPNVQYKAIQANQTEPVVPGNNG